MPTFADREGLASVRTKLNDAILLAEATAVDLSVEIGLANLAATQAQGYATVAQQSATDAQLALDQLTDEVEQAQAWAESPTAPGLPGTKSSKTWAEESAVSAASVSGLVSTINSAVQPGDDVDVLAETATAKIFTGTERTKLAGVATGATANDTNAALRARSSHTGTQTASTISDFGTAVSANASVVANTAKVTNATHTGDVTGATALTIGTAKVTNAKLANMATATIKGRVTAATGVPEDLTASQARTVLGLGTAALTASTDYATSAQGALASTALQPGANIPWTNVTGKPTTFTPSAHTHIIADTTGLQTALDAKYTFTNIVGTASQSAGVPTGAIVETGSNSNGRYVRFADGTQICWAYLDGSTGGSHATAIATGSTFFTSNPQLTWAYPAAFVGSVGDINVVGSIRRGSLLATGMTIYNPSAATCSFVPWSSVSLTAADQKFFLLQAFGRWY